MQALGASAGGQRVRTGACENRGSCWEPSAVTAPARSSENKACKGSRGLRGRSSPVTDAGGRPLPRATP